MTYENALKKAKKARTGITHCTEYKDGYCFYNPKDSSDGTKGPVFIDKKTGEALNYTWFLTNSQYSKTKIRTFKVDDKTKKTASKTKKK